MKQYEVTATLNRIRDARKAVIEAHRDINTQAARSMRRLLFEAAQNRMSVEEVAKASGYTKARIRALMRQHGLDPRWSKTLLEKHAAASLAENAELLGIDPVDMDLMSPLAYLPAGEQLRRDVDQTRVRAVTELTETRWWIESVTQGVDTLYEVYCGERDEPEFVATFEREDEAKRVIALVNGVHETEDEDETIKRLRGLVRQLGFCPDCGWALGGPCECEGDDA